jgi:hypothetical protein
VTEGDEDVERAGDRLVAQVDALWAGGPPARGRIAHITDGGVFYFEVRALALRCLGCGVTIPQSRTRIAADARRAWLLHHARCSTRHASAARARGA